MRPALVLVYGTFVIAFCSALHLRAQPFWQSAGLPGSGGWLQALYASDDGERIYYGGLRDLDPVTLGFQTALLKYSVAGWDTLWVNGEVQSIVEFHDTLFVGGHFETNPYGPDSLPAYNVEYWQDSAWHTLGVFDDWLVRSLKVIDDTLYAVGSFREVDGQPCTGMIRLVNGQWQPLPPIPEPDQGGIITDIIKFQGKLIAVGGIYIGNGNGIAYLDGDQWHILGPGLEAGFSSIHSMTVFQDQLYVGGQLAITTGNPGKDIMRWDGTQFHALGTGLERALGDQSTFTDCRALTVHNDLLYAGGGFRYAGGVAAKGVASWDGTQWCGVPGNLTVPTGGVTEIAFFQDTMFVICGHLADGDSVGMAAKFIGESYIDSCSGSVGFAEPNRAEAQDVLAHFTPDGNITAWGLPVGTTAVQLFDLQGRAMHVGRLTVGADGTAILHPGPLPPGNYVLHIGGHAVPIPNTP